jgi:hypothetical protein
MTSESPATPEQPPTPVSGLLVGVVPLPAARKQHSPENDGTDHHGRGHGERMADWLRHLSG